VSQANVKLRIEELILDGLPYNQRQRVAAALERALQRLIAEQGLPQDAASRALSGIGPIEVSRHARAETVGQQVAHAIYRQLSSPSSDRMPPGNSPSDGATTGNSPGNLPAAPDGGLQ
jgi:hypothetical protein